ncbi:unannotated protein [freshwater metagenome]|uniref:Unannotated protein n=1 Tax=freshwater metagenome TaxID=449393 RepID=A0A6J7EYZ2_9ZZZZ
MRPAIRPVDSRWNTPYGIHMATVNLTEETFAATISDNPIVFVDFWAAWCGPCRTFGPVYDSVATQNPDILFAKIDTEAEQGLAAAAGISSIPTLMAIRDGIVVYNQAGALPAPNLASLVEAVRAVDMEALRSSLSSGDTSEA